jgi:hypothetical protein
VKFFFFGSAVVMSFSRLFHCTIFFLLLPQMLLGLFYNLGDQTVVVVSVPFNHVLKVADSSVFVFCRKQD